MSPATDDICLLDVRLYVVAFMLAVAWVSPRAFEPRRARVAVTVFVTALVVMWGRQLHGAAREARTVVSLVERIDPKESLLALPFVVLSFTYHAAVLLYSPAERRAQLQPLFGDAYGVAARCALRL